MEKIVAAAKAAAAAAATEAAAGAGGSGGGGGGGGGGYNSDRAPAVRSLYFTDGRLPSERELAAGAAAESYVWSFPVSTTLGGAASRRSRHSGGAPSGDLGLPSFATVLVDTASAANGVCTDRNETRVFFTTTDGALWAVRRDGADPVREPERETEREGERDGAAPAAVSVVLWAPDGRGSTGGVTVASRDAERESRLPDGSPA